MSRNYVADGAPSINICLFSGVFENLRCTMASEGAQPVKPGDVFSEEGSSRTSTLGEIRNVGIWGLVDGLFVDGLGKPTQAGAAHNGDLGVTQLGRHIRLQKLGGFGGALVGAAHVGDDVVGGHGEADFSAGLAG